MKATEVNEPVLSGEGSGGSGGPPTTGTELLPQPNEEPVDPIADLKARAELQSERHQVIQVWLRDSLKKGLDFGDIINKKTGRPIGKPFLFKPGAEKVCTLLQVRPIFKRDDDTWEAFGKTPGLVCYVCRLVKMDDETICVGEGRGCARLDEKQGWTENNCVKIAEKRAQVDAVLRVANLSEVFTQDEDFQGTKPAPAARRPNASLPVQQPPPSPLAHPLTHPSTSPVDPEEEIPEIVTESIQHMLALNQQLKGARLNINLESLVARVRQLRAAGLTWSDIEDKMDQGSQKIDAAMQAQLERRDST